jgi:hypothetical protein
MLGTMSGPGPAESAELDLDTAEPAPVPSRRLPRWAWGAAGLAVGLLAGHAWLPAGRPEPVQAASPAAAPVRLAFGAYQMWTPDVPYRLGSRLVLRVPAVVVNASPGTLVVREVRATGPGASALTSAVCAPSTAPPFAVPPGQERDLPFCLLSDCRVAVRPVPRITVVVAPDAGGPATEVETPLPDLARLWGTSLGRACEGSDPG